MRAEMEINLVTNSNYSINNFEKLNLLYNDDNYFGKFLFIGDSVEVLKIKLKNKLENIFKHIHADVYTTDDLMTLFKVMLRKIDEADINESNYYQKFLEAKMGDVYEGTDIAIYFTGVGDVVNNKEK